MSQETYVYGLLDPRTERVFYIGITKWNLPARLAGHRSDPASAAWQRIREIEADDFRCEIEAILDCPTREIARSWERRLIREFPGLINRDRR